LLARARALPQPRDLRVRAAGLRGAIASRTGSVESARDELMTAAADAAGTDPDTAVLLLADAILACFFLADTATVADAGARIDGLVPRVTGEPARRMGAVAAGVAGVLTGRGGPERIRLALRPLESGGPLLRDPRLAPWLVLGVLFLRERGTGRAIVPAVVDDLRRRSDLGGLPFLLFLVARDRATGDRWDVAEADYTEGVQLGRETGSTSELAACLAGLAWLQARQGRADACRANAAEVLEVSGPRHLALFQVWALSALGNLELGLGRPEAALAHLERLDALLTDLALVDVDLSPVPELAEALVHLGRAEDARRPAARYAARATEKGQPWAMARAARTVALTCADADIDREFGRALDHHGEALDPFERARTQLAYGARLRRARRRVDAREQLRAALTAFDTLGAAPWADRAAAELRATGETAQRRQAGPAGDLTPQELQIATMLARGRTTREAAAALFLSPKTVEYHLRHVYLKLGVSSRAELAGRLAVPG
ncbi:LuxR family transcriptional regulator, partial [Blastococcus sp. CT_GayMR20]|uniref:helix-turn-helix transcriptional regulator n=1 Tax=Blastococcus sp. CT_GayMR20 TaxID=2559609 RepID=UPI0010744115